MWRSPGGVHVDTLTLAASAGAVLPISGEREIAPGTYRIVWNGVLTLFDPDARPFGNELALEHRVSAPITIEHDPPAKTP